MTKSRLGNLAVTGAVSTATITRAHATEREETLRAVDPRTLAPSPFQPRGAIDPASDAFTALVESVRAHGILQPPTVRELPGGGLELLAGERRTRAAIAADLPTIPVRVRAHVTDADARALALLENLAREDLTAWEEARGLAALRDALALAGEPSTVRELAKHSGRSVGHTSESLSMADRLSPDVLALAGVRDVQAMNTLPRDALKSAMGSPKTPPAERAALLRRMLAGYKAPAPGMPTRKKLRAAPFTVTGKGPLTKGGAVRITGPVAGYSPDEARALLDTLTPVVKALRARLTLTDRPERMP